MTARTAAQHAERAHLWANDAEKAANHDHDEATLCLRMATMHALVSLALRK